MVNNRWLIITGYILTRLWILSQPNNNHNTTIYNTTHPPQTKTTWERQNRALSKKQKSCVGYILVSSKRITRLWDSTTHNLTIWWNCHQIVKLSHKLYLGELRENHQIVSRHNSLSGETSQSGEVLTRLRVNKVTDLTCGQIWYIVKYHKIDISQSGDRNLPDRFTRLCI